jgi:uncharacterized oxidoreductase
MQFENRTFLITGGTQGIGLGLAKALMHAGAQVAVCSRSSAHVDTACKETSGLKGFVCDVRDPASVDALWSLLASAGVHVDVLINNAGVSTLAGWQWQRSERLELAKLSDCVNADLQTNLAAVFLMTSQFLQQARNARQPAIVNFGSALCFAPNPDNPLYCATQAARHSLTLSMRHQLVSHSIAVVEIMPPGVDTALNQYTGDRISVVQCVQAIMAGLSKDRQEIVIGQARILRLIAKFSVNRAMKLVSRRRFVPAAPTA